MSHCCRPKRIPRQHVAGTLPATFQGLRELRWRYKVEGLHLCQGFEGGSGQ